MAHETYRVQSKFTTIVCSETSFIEANNVAEHLNGDIMQMVSCFETIMIGINSVNPIRDALHLAGHKFSLISSLFGIFHVRTTYHQCTGS